MSTSPQPSVPPQQPAPDWRESRGLDWVFAGDRGLRAGWAVLLAYGFFYLFRMVVGTVFVTANLVSDQNDYAPGSMLMLELVPFLAMVATGALMAVIEHRSILDYNLAGSRRWMHFAAGLGTGFAVFSALIGALRLGGWLRFGPAALAGAEMVRMAALWGCAFLVVGCVEEGMFRCYLQFTLTRGINFWWALAAQTALCFYTFGNAGGDGARGVYLAAAVGLFPCLILHQKSAPRSGFWQAAWVGSTWFGMIHTFNGGENWRGIFAAACMGFVFCVSVRVTGSAWWAIGCHTAWDWAETYLYGTADSGLPAQRHLLTSAPAGNPLWSGGTDGPEGSVLALAAIALLLAVLLAVHGRRKAAAERSYPVAD
jgi:membrane protease YdiL (CAAX protease family)